MPEYSAGSAAVRIRPNADDFVRDLRRQLAAQRDPGFSVRVEADVDSARRDTRAWRDEESQRNIGLDVDVDTAGATAHVESWRRTQEARDLNIKVGIDVTQAQAQLAGLRRSAGLGGGLSGALKWNVGALGLAGLPAVATGLAEVAASLQQVSQAALVVPGVIAGGVSSIGTLAVGMSGLKDAYKAAGDAASGSAADMAKAEEAMSELSPAGREVVQTLSEITPTLKALRNTVQQRMFTGIAAEMRGLATDVIPSVEKGLGGIADGWNQNMVALSTTLRSSTGTGLIDRILGNTGDAQAKFSAAINPLVVGIGTLSAAGTDALPRLADGLTSVSERFKNFITSADRDGRLDTWINDGLDGLTSLGNVALNVGKSFTAITQAANADSGRTFLQWLEDASSRMVMFLGSTDGQNKLKAFFDQARDTASQLKPILESLPGIFEGLMSAAQGWTATILPPLGQIATVLGEHPDLIRAVATAFVTWRTIDGVSTLVSTLGNIGSSLDLLPGKADTAAAGINKAFAIIAIPAIGKMLNDELDKFLQENAPTLDRLNHTNTPDQLGKSARDWVDEHLLERPGTAGAQPVWAPNSANTPTVGGIPIPGLQRPGTPAAPAVTPPPPKSSEPATVGGIPIPGLVVPSRLKGGPSPTSGTRGPTGGIITELHPHEWVLPAHARAEVGDRTLWSLTRGRSFAPGGTIDEQGNPVTPGPAPGPVPGGMIAPNPTTGGPGFVQSLIGGIASGIQNPIGNALSLGSSLLGMAGGPNPVGDDAHGIGNGLVVPTVPSIADRAAGLPGLAGLFASFGSSNPGENLMAWGSQTGQWLGNFAASTAASFGSTLWQGALGFFGLQNSILSPSNPYFRAATQVAGFGLGNDGPLGSLMATDQDSASPAAEQVSAQKLRSLADKVTDADNRVNVAQARMAELGSDAKPSTRMNAQNQLDKAVREAAQARGDLSTLTGGGSTTPTSLAAAVPADGVGAERWRGVVRQALATYGPQYGVSNSQAWEDAIIRQIGTESGGIPNAYNGNDSNGRGGRQVVAGIGQFLRSTFDANNITGGDYMDPVAQISAMIPYVATRYGMDANGAPLGIGRGHGYAAGGPTPSRKGPGPTGGYLAEVHPDEFMISARGRATVPDAFLHKLNAGLIDPKGLAGFAPGGAVTVSQGVVVPPPRPNFQVPNAKTITPAPAPRPTTVVPQTPPSAPTPAPAPQTVAPVAPTPAPAAQAPAKGPAASGSAAPTVAPAPKSLNHNLDWINTAIQSGAATLGNLAATAASMGIGAAGGGPLGGLAGSLIAGGFQQGGKIVQGLANVVSSALVGSVPGSFGGEPGARAYGQSVLPEQSFPDLRMSAGGNKTYNFNGISDVDRLMNRMELADKVEFQAEMANHFK